MVVLAGQAIRGVALGVVVTALVQSILGGIGLVISGVPFVAVLTAIMFALVSPSWDRSSSLPGQPSGPTRPRNRLGYLHAGVDAGGRHPGQFPAPGTDPSRSRPAAAAHLRRRHRRARCVRCRRHIRRTSRTGSRIHAARRLGRDRRAGSRIQLLRAPRPGNEQHAIHHQGEDDDDSTTFHQQPADAHRHAGCVTGRAARGHAGARVVHAGRHAGQGGERDRHRGDRPGPDCRHRGLLAGAHPAREDRAQAPSPAAGGHPGAVPAVARVRRIALADRLALGLHQAGAAQAGLRH